MRHFIPQSDLFWRRICHWVSVTPVREKNPSLGNGSWISAAAGRKAFSSVILSEINNWVGWSQKSLRPWECHCWQSWASPGGQQPDVTAEVAAVTMIWLLSLFLWADFLSFSFSRADGGNWFVLSLLASVPRLLKVNLQLLLVSHGVKPDLWLGSAQAWLQGEGQQLQGP